MKAVTRRIHNKQAKLVEQRLQCSSINLHKHQSFDAAAQPPEQKDIGHNQTAATISNTTQQLFWYTINDERSCRGTFLPSISTGDSRGHQTKGRGTYPAHFHQLVDHDNAEAVLLPNHPPEIVDHLLLGACGGGDMQQKCRWRSGRRRKSEDRRWRKKKRGGKFNHKSEKLAAIANNVEVLHNPCQGRE